MTTDSWSMASAKPARVAGLKTMGHVPTAIQAGVGSVAGHQTPLVFELRLRVFEHATTGQHHDRQHPAENCCSPPRRSWL